MARKFSSKKHRVVSHASDQAQAPAGAETSYNFMPDGRPTQLVWENDHSGALLYRRRVTQPAKFTRPDDTTIDQVIANREHFVSEMVQAVYNMEDIHDNLTFRAAAMFVIGSTNQVSGHDVEAACRLLFDIIIDRCENGYRGPASIDRNLQKGDRIDRDGTCEARMQNVITALRDWKSVCKEILSSDAKIEHLANAPANVWKDKKEQQKNNMLKKQNTQHDGTSAILAAQGGPAASHVIAGNLPPRSRASHQQQHTRSSRQRREDMEHEPNPPRAQKPGAFEIPTSSDIYTSPEAAQYCFPRESQLDLASDADDAKYPPSRRSNRTLPRESYPSHQHQTVVSRQAHLLSPTAATFVSRAPVPNEFPVFTSEVNRSAALGLGDYDPQQGNYDGVVASSNDSHYADDFGAQHPRNMTWAPHASACPLVAPFGEAMPHHGPWIYQQPVQLSVVPQVGPRSGISFGSGVPQPEVPYSGGFHNGLPHRPGAKHARTATMEVHGVPVPTRFKQDQEHTERTSGPEMEW